MGFGEQREDQTKVSTEPVLRIVWSSVSIGYQPWHTLVPANVLERGPKRKIHTRNERKQLHTPNDVGKRSLKRRIHSIDNVSRSGSIGLYCPGVLSTSCDNYFIPTDLALGSS